MAWRRPGDRPLSQPMMKSLLTHICITRPQWVKPMHAIQRQLNHQCLCDILQYSHITLKYSVSQWTCTQFVACCVSLGLVAVSFNLYPSWLFDWYSTRTISKCQPGKSKNRDRWIKKCNKNTCILYDIPIPINLFIAFHWLPPLQRLTLVVPNSINSLRPSDEDMCQQTNHHWFW